MQPKTTPARQPEAVTQFSVFTPNRLGRLHDLVGMLAAHGVHVLALTVLDTTDSAIIRFAVDDPDRARGLLVNHGFPFTESQLLAVEADAAPRRAFAGSERVLDDPDLNTREGLLRLLPEVRRELSTRNPQ